MKNVRKMKKMVSNYETTPKTEYKGYLDAAPLQLEQIVVVQRSERVVEWVAVSRLAPRSRKRAMKERQRRKMLMDE